MKEKNTLFDTLKEIYNNLDMIKERSMNDLISSNLVNETKDSIKKLNNVLSKYAFISSGLEISNINRLIEDLKDEEKNCYLIGIKTTKNFYSLNNEDIQALIAYLKNRAKNSNNIKNAYYYDEMFWLLVNGKDCADNTRRQIKKAKIIDCDLIPYYTKIENSSKKPLSEIMEGIRVIKTNILQKQEVINNEEI